MLKSDVVTTSKCYVTELISEKKARQIAEEFSREVARKIDGHLKAVVVIGSLADGNYKAGKSDTVLIVDDDFTREQKIEVKQIAISFRDKYGIPKDFGAVVIKETELKPPFEPTQELVPEILRLKRQGVIISGNYVLSNISEPTIEDIKGVPPTF